MMEHLCLLGEQAKASYRVRSDAAAFYICRLILSTVMPNTPLL